MELAEFAWNAGFVAPLLTPQVSPAPADIEAGGHETVESPHGGGR
jgi:hypothetical protein